MAEQGRPDRFQEGLRHALETIEETNQAIQRRTGRDLVMAILIGLALGGAIVGSLLLLPVLFAVLVAVATAFGALELAVAFRAIGVRVPVIPLMPAALAIPMAGWFFGVEGLWLALLVGAGAVVLWRTGELIIGRLRRGTATGPGREPAPSSVVSPGSIVSDWAAAGFILAYVPFLAGFAVVLSALPAGAAWVIGFVIVVVVIDTAAYAVGMSFGRTPMAPRISPKKSWEGFAGAVVAALAAGALVAWLLLDQPWWFGLLFAAVLLFTATVGDFAESWLKRDLGVKDMSGWLPGHGGFLDRLDSMLPSCAAAYLLFALLTHFG